MPRPNWVTRAPGRPAGRAPRPARPSRPRTGMRARRPPRPHPLPRLGAQRADHRLGLAQHLETDPLAAAPSRPSATSIGVTLTRRPSRRTATESQTWARSASRWVATSMVTPMPRTSFSTSTSSRRPRPSSPPSGSSSNRIGGLCSSARASASRRGRRAREPRPRRGAGRGGPPPAASSRRCCAAPTGDPGRLGEELQVLGDTQPRVDAELLGT